MKERPILFQAPMVRANRKGIKTQTRRLGNRFYGDVGDRLWVRETAWIFGPEWCFYDKSNATDDVGRPRKVGYCADNVSPHCFGFCGEKQVCGCTHMVRLCGKKTPSILMPRWASRDNLVITAPQREQRLLDITEEEALSEGIVELAREPAAQTPWWLVSEDNLGGMQSTQDACWFRDIPGGHRHTTDPREAYIALFRTINADKLKGEENPVVQVVTYKLERQC